MPRHEIKLNIKYVDSSVKAIETTLPKFFKPKATNNGLSVICNTPDDLIRAMKVIRSHRNIDPKPACHFNKITLKGVEFGAVTNDMYIGNRCVLCVDEDLEAAEEKLKSLPDVKNVQPVIRFGGKELLFELSKSEVETVSEAVRVTNKIAEEMDFFGGLLYSTVTIDGIRIYINNY